MDPGTLNFAEPAPGRDYDADHAGQAYQGATFRRVVRIRERLDDGAPGDYLDLTGWAGRAQVRHDVHTNDAAATMAVTVLDQTATRGGVRLELTPEQTLTLNCGDYGWDLLLTNPAGDVEPYLRGTFVVEQSYTRP